MTDPIFKAPPVQAPNFNQPLEQANPVPPVSPVAPAQSISQAPVASETPSDQPIVLQEQKQGENNTNIPLTQTQQTSQNSTQAKMDELRQKLSKLDLTEVKEKIQKRLWAVLGGCFLIGMMFGCSMAGGEEQPQQKHGLELRAITKQNSDIHKNLVRCGRTEQMSDGCLYYIMNFDHFEKKAEDFFEEVANKTGRQQFRIQTENPTYGQQLIPPGYFAQIIVPSLN